MSPQLTPLATVEVPQVPAAPRESRPARVRLALNNPVDARRQLARVYREMYVGRMDPNVATKHAYVLMGLVKVFESVDLANRIDELEQRERRAG